MNPSLISSLQLRSWIARFQNMVHVTLEGGLNRIIVGSGTRMESSVILLRMLNAWMMMKIWWLLGSIQLDGDLFCYVIRLRTIDTVGGQSMSIPWDGRVQEKFHGSYGGGIKTGQTMVCYHQAHHSMVIALLVIVKMSAFRISQTWFIMNH